MYSRSQKRNWPFSGGRQKRKKMASKGAWSGRNPIWPNMRTRNRRLRESRPKRENATSPEQSATRRSEFSGFQGARDSESQVGRAKRSGGWGGRGGLHKKTTRLHLLTITLLDHALRPPIKHKASPPPRPHPPRPRKRSATSTSASPPHGGALLATGDECPCAHAQNERGDCFFFCTPPCRATTACRRHLRLSVPGRRSSDHRADIRSHKSHGHTHRIAKPAPCAIAARPRLTVTTRQCCDRKPHNGGASNESKRGGMRLRTPVRRPRGWT